ncbi:hypothetical protein CIHG_08434 [Coccidioides immitis H538.4]|uniref:Uncharacterized protein n=2 Tax=Coccidioides immitis TaxID=5501 RepID=A0A0J8USG4_COCIT|nr:hypothetical protein CIRG_02705 [Coccidioides immitis RMSCC 2394]KMU90623.1 hypothetical protein CIHG_08434 [Coccidioides immitis H538.4]
MASLRKSGDAQEEHIPDHHGSKCSSYAMKEHSTHRDCERMDLEDTDVSNEIPHEIPRLFGCIGSKGNAIGKHIPGAMGIYDIPRILRENKGLTTPFHGRQIRRRAEGSFEAAI